MGKALWARDKHGREIGNTTEGRQELGTQGWRQREIKVKTGRKKKKDELVPVWPLEHTAKCTGRDAVSAVLLHHHDEPFSQCFLAGRQRATPTK